jgi:glucan 1,3-beta-glucosidase
LVYSVLAKQAALLHRCYFKKIDIHLLKRYSAEAYARIRQYCRPDDVAVVFHDGFRPYTEYLGFLAPPEFDNTVFDIHRYQCFT